MCVNQAYYMAYRADYKQGPSIQSGGKEACTDAYLFYVYLTIITFTMTTSSFQDKLC